MDVQFKKSPCVLNITWGNRPHKVEQDSGWEVVMVDGRQGGYVPSKETDPNYRVFHPLSGFPQALCQSVVDASDGRLTRFLNAPQPVEELPEDEDDDE
jgi:hypothetical protein